MNRLELEKKAFDFKPMFGSNTRNNREIAYKDDATYYQCAKCNEFKSKNDYRPLKKDSDKIFSYCKKCQSVSTYISSNKNARVTNVSGNSKGVIQENKYQVNFFISEQDGYYKIMYYIGNSYVYKYAPIKPFMYKSNAYMSINTDLTYKVEELEGITHNEIQDTIKKD